MAFLAYIKNKLSCFGKKIFKKWQKVFLLILMITLYMLTIFFVCVFSFVIILKYSFQGMSLSTEMLVDIAQTHGDSHVRPLEAELINLKRQVMTDKQILQEQSMTLSGKIEQLRPLSVSAH